MQIPVYTCYSKTHVGLYRDYFLRTFDRTKTTLVARTIPQVCQSGHFRKAGWSRMGLEKVKVMLEACRDNEVFIFSDCDVVFCRPIVDAALKLLGNHDLAAQTERNSYCSGFFICRRNDRTLAMFEAMQRLLTDATQEYMADQYALNECIKMVHARSIPIHTVCSPLYWRDNAITSELQIRILNSLPPRMLVFHANWCCGLNLKALLLNRVLSLMFDSEMEDQHDAAL